MITDIKAMENLRVSWDGVRLLRLKIDRTITGSATLPGSFTVFIADAAHNLPFLHACGVFNTVLRQLAKERCFSYQGESLGLLIKASVKLSPPVSWVNLQLINEAVKHRHALAHRAKIIPRGDCWRYIDAIEAELVQWGIVDAPP
jgi:hypothetical protein